MKKLLCAIGAAFLAAGALAQAAPQVVPQFGLDKNGTGCRRVTIYDANKTATDKTTPLGCVDPVNGFLPVIPAASVLNSQLATVPSATFKGRASTGTGAAEDLSAAQAKVVLGLDQVSNTPDASKPVSAAAQSALNLKYDATNPSAFVNAAGAAAAAPVQTVAGRSGSVTLSNADVGLGNVENKSSATILGQLSSYAGNIATSGTLSGTAATVSGPFNLVEQAAPAAAASGEQTLYFDSTTHLLRRMDSSGMSWAIGGITINAGDYGAKCDGTTDDAAAINSALAAARAKGTVPGTGFPWLIGRVAKFAMPAGQCIIKSSINMTGFYGSGLTFDFTGSAIICQTSGTPCIDAIGLGMGQIVALNLYGSETNTPNVGLALGRITNNGTGADRNVLERPTITGYFTLGAYYNRESETTSVFHGTFINRQANAYAAVWDGGNHFNIQSAFTGNTYPVDTLLSFNENTCVGCMIGTTASGSSAMWIGGTSRHRFINGYAYTSPPAGAVTSPAVVIYFGNARYNDMLDFDVHVEDNGGAGRQSSIFQFAGASNAVMNGFNWTDNYPEQTGPVFARASGVSTVQLNNVNFVVGNFAHPQSWWDSAAAYTVSGRVFDQSGSFTAPGSFSGTACMPGSCSNSFTAPPSLSFGSIGNTGSLSAITITSAGAYLNGSPSTVTIGAPPPGGQQAAASITTWQLLGPGDNPSATAGGGSGYAVGDVMCSTGGTANAGQFCLRATSVDGNGAVTGYTYNSGGIYYSAIPAAGDTPTACGSPCHGTGWVFRNTKWVPYAVTITSPGSGFISAPSIVMPTGPAGGAIATATSTISAAAPITLTTGLAVTGNASVTAGLTAATVTSTGAINGAAITGTSLNTTGAANVGSVASTGGVSGSTVTATGVVTGGSFSTAGSANVGSLVSGGSLSVATLLKMGNYTVAALPTCSAANIDTMAVITDSKSPSLKGTFTGGGTYRVPVYCDGTSWAVTQTPVRIRYDTTAGYQSILIGDNAGLNMDFASVAKGMYLCLGAYTCGGEGTGLVPGAVNSESTALGWACLSHLTTGTYNTCTGVGSLRAETTGSGNTADGVDCMSGGTGNTSSICIGNNALGLGVNIRSIGIGSFAGHAVAGATITDSQIMGINALAAPSLVSSTNNQVFGTNVLQGTGVNAPNTNIIHGNYTLTANSVVSPSNNTIDGHYILNGGYVVSPIQNDLSGIGIMNNSNAVSPSYNVIHGYNACNTCYGNGNTINGYNAGTGMTSAGSNTIYGANVATTTLKTGTGNALYGTSNAVDTPAAGSVNYSNFNNTFMGYATKPTASSGFGSGSTVTGSGTAAFKIVVGSGGGSATSIVTLGTAPNGWVCIAQNETGGKAGVQTADSASAVTITWPAAPAANDNLVFKCAAY